MRHALSIFRKDLRRLWHLALASCVTLIFGYFLTVSNLDPSFHLLRTGVETLRLVCFELSRVGPVFFLTIWLVQQDVAVGDRAAWLTRPISGGALAFGKFLFIFFAIVLPVTAISFCAALWFKAPLALAIGSSLENFLLVLMVALIAAMLAACTANMGGAVLAAAGLLLLLVAVGFWNIWFKFALPRPTPPFPSRFIVQCVGMNASLLLALGFQYATRRRPFFALTLAAVLVFSASVVGRYLPITLWRDWPANTSTHATPIEEIHFAVEPKQISTSAYDFQSGKQVDILMPLHLERVPAGRAFVLRELRSILTIEGDSQPRSSSPATSQTVLPYVDGWQVEERATLTALGFPFPHKEPLRERSLSFFTMPISEAAKLQGRTAHLVSRLTLVELRYFVAARMPAKSGAVLRANGFFCKVRGVRSWPNGYGLDLQIAQIESELQSRRLEGLPGYVLVNPKRNQFSSRSNGRYSGSGLPTIGLRADQPIFEMSYDSKSGAETGKLDHAWLADAELCVLETENIATSVKEVSVEGLIMPTVD